MQISGKDFQCPDVLPEPLEFRDPNVQLNNRLKTHNEGGIHLSKKPVLLFSGKSCRYYEAKGTFFLFVCVYIETYLYIHVHTITHTQTHIYSSFTPENNTHTTDT